MISKLLEKLRNKKYRDLFVAGQIKTGIPFQIRAMRDQRGWTQEELGKRSGLPQSAIARLENPDTIHSPNIKTFQKLASAFDVALIVRFAPFTELIHWVESIPHEVRGLSLKALTPQGYTEDVQLYKSPTTNDAYGDLKTPATTISVSLISDSAEGTYNAYSNAIY